MGIMMLRLVIVLIILAASNQYLYANAGTPLLWGTSFHLSLANIVIAIIESYLIYKLSKRYKYLITFVIIFMANICSAIVGWLFLYIYSLIKSDGLLNYTAYEGFLAFIGLFFLTYIFSVIVEFPFIKLSLPKTYTNKKVFLVDIRVNGISYSILAIIYFIFFMMNGF
jgi:hypothetical protein